MKFSSMILALGILDYRHHLRFNIKAVHFHPSWHQALGNSNEFLIDNIFAHSNKPWPLSVFMAIKPGSGNPKHNPLAVDVPILSPVYEPGP
jgi:hypothetical protein